MTGKIFLKLIAGVFCLLLLALVTVDYFATNVAKDNYIQNLTGQLADKGRMLALSFGAEETLDAARVRRMAQAANERIITGVGERLQIPPERCMNNIGRYGNTSAASIPIALDEYARDGQLKRGDLRSEERRV